MAIVAICRGTRTYATQLAECLAGELDFPVLDEEVIGDAAAHLGVSVADLQERMGDRPSLWEPFSAMRRTYLLALQAALADRVVEGNLVYHGLTGGLLLTDVPATLTARCLAPMAMRTRAVVQATDMDWSTAERYIRDLDEARDRWVKVIHKVDVADPGLYDVVINLENLTIDAACGMIAGMLGQPEFEVTPEVQAGLRDFRTASHVRLALVEDERLRGLELDAEAEGGRVTITGSVPARASGKTGDRIAAAARTVPGVEDVNLRVEWFDPYP